MLSPLYTQHENDSPTQRQSHLSLRTPDILQVTIPLRQSVQRIVRLAARAHKAAQSVHLVLASVVTVLIDLADGDLHGGVVVGLDNAVGRAALARDVAIRKFISLARQIM